MKSKPQKKDLISPVKEQPQEKDLISPVKEQPQEKDLIVAEKKQPKVIEIPTAVKEPPKKVITPVDLGTRYKCYKCGTKFYDLGRPEPLCPSCGVNQNDDETKGNHKKKIRRRSAYMGKADPVIFTPEERDDVIEVVSEVDVEYAVDADDIVEDVCCCC